MNYTEFFSSLKNKRVAVIGIGVSNTPLIKMLNEYGALVTACDLKKTIDDIPIDLKNLNIDFKLGKDYLFGLDHDYIIKSPGIRYDIPELLEAEKRGSKVTSEMEIFFELCPAPIYAITGSDGKTTTTTLVYELLKAQGYVCHLGGNIGKPLLPEIMHIKETDKVVVELSSFQLHKMRKSPHCAIITNLSPNHLDWHIDMNEYVDAKKNIYKYQSGNDFLVTNYDNEITKDISNEFGGNLRLFSRLSQETDIYVKDDAIFYNGAFIMKKEDILLRGEHNVENYMAAILAVIDEVSVENIRKVAKTFSKIAHRMEFIREYNGIKFYNDSIASSPTRAIAGLKSFDEKVIMIAGGYDKNLSYDEMGIVVNEKVKKLILCGATSDKIKTSVLNASNYNNLPIVKVNGFEETIKEALKDAKPGDSVILCPASASFDMFKNFEERGNKFKELINLL